MGEYYLGQIQQFGFNFPPRNWLLCNGQLLPINQYQSLYSLLGTYYGGNGRTDFALPDLRGRVSLNQGDGPGLTPRSVGNKGGVETVTLKVAELPSHQHSFAPGAATIDGDASSPGGNYPATRSGAYSSAAPTAMGTVNSADTGGNGFHDNNQPSLVVNWCICIAGLFPPRN